MTQTATIHTLTITDWIPARLNQLLAGRWQCRRLKKLDRELVALCAHQQFVPKIRRGQRRVSLAITLGPRQRAGDPDAYWKSLLDALVHAGLLVDDNRQGVELGPVTFTRGPRKATAITLEDL